MFVPQGQTDLSVTMPTDSTMNKENVNDREGGSGKPEERVVTATMETESAKRQQVNELRERERGIKPENREATNITGFWVSKASDLASNSLNLS